MKRELTGNFVNDCFDLSAVVKYIAQDIQRVSTAFAVVGQHHTSEILEEFQIELSDVAELIKKLCQNKTERDLNETVEMNKELLEKIIARSIESDE
jgi:hypothetical protein